MTAFPCRVIEKLFELKSVNVVELFVPSRGSSRETLEKLGSAAPGTEPAPPTHAVDTLHAAPGPML